MLFKQKYFQTVLNSFTQLSIEINSPVKTHHYLKASLKLNCLIWPTNSPYLNSIKTPDELELLSLLYFVSALVKLKTNLDLLH